LFYPHSIELLYVKPELIVRFCYVNRAFLSIHVVFSHIFAVFFAIIDTIRVFHTLGANLLFISRIILSVISGCLTECQTVRICVHFMLYFAHCHWFFWHYLHEYSVLLCHMFVSVIIVNLYNMLSKLHCAY